MSDVDAQLRRLAGLIEGARDVVCGRVEDTEAPAWCADRGFSAWLLALTDDELERCERDGLAPSLAHVTRAPASLADLVLEAHAAAALAAAAPRVAPALSSASPRKAAQVDAMLDAVIAHDFKPDRVVDFGAGRGHLTRSAALRLDVEAVGLERDAARVERARALTHVPGARFVAGDVREVDGSSTIDLGGDAPPLGPRDLAIGLHACGALGDDMARVAAASGASLALVGCCPQKILSPERVGLCACTPTLPKDALGLANLATGDHGVEKPRALSLRARASRLAVRVLLEARGERCEPGDEMRGINRKRARDPLPSLVARALAVRGLASASDAEVKHAQGVADRRHAAARRLSLPRAALARPLEVMIALDRAAFLAARGHHLTVVELVPQETTPRNVAVLAKG